MTTNDLRKADLGLIGMISADLGPLMFPYCSRPQQQFKGVAGKSGDAERPTSETVLVR